MGQPLMAGLAMLTGAIAVTIGWLMGRHALRAAQRSHHRTAALAALMEGWQEWFIGGFSGAALGIRWLSALMAGLLWVVAGGALVWLGIRLLV